MIPLWPEPIRPPRRWTPRCQDCGRRIWSPAALRPRYGRLLGDTCHRRRRAQQRRLTLRITFTPPGHIPGQLDLLETT